MAKNKESKVKRKSEMTNSEAECGGKAAINNQVFDLKKIHW